MFHKLSPSFQIVINISKTYATLLIWFHIPFIPQDAHASHTIFVKKKMSAVLTQLGCSVFPRWPFIRRLDKSIKRPDEIP